MIATKEAVGIIADCRSPLQAAQKLTRIARARWLSRQATSDDITVLVAYLDGNK